MRATRPNLIEPVEPTAPDVKKNTIRVLVIDDDEADYFTVKRMLSEPSNTHYESFYVSNYIDAVRALRSNKYDAVLLDYFINGRSTKDVYEAVDGSWDVPVIVFTGSADRALEDQVLAAGAFDFLNKNVMCPESLMLSISFAIRRFQIDEKVRVQHETLLRNCENARAENFSKTEFLSFLGDEIKTPLNAIVGFSRALQVVSRKSDVPEVFDTYSSTIQDSSCHLLNLIEDLLELSKTGPEDFDVRGRRFKRFRTWIVDRQGDTGREDERRAEARISRRAAS